MMHETSLNLRPHSTVSKCGLFRFPTPGCHTISMRPRVEGHALNARNKDEQKSCQAAEEIDRRILKSGLLYDDAELELYLNSVTTRLIAAQASQRNWTHSQFGEVRNRIIFRLAGL